jgi:anti-sigma factor RsiW
MPQQALETLVQSPPPELTCQQVIALLVDYVTGAMEAETRAAFATHLRDCTECENFFATYEATLRALRSVRHEALPAALLTRVQQFLRQRIDRLSPHHLR